METKRFLNEKTIMWKQYYQNVSQDSQLVKWIKVQLMWFHRLELAGVHMHLFLNMLCPFRRNDLLLSLVPASSEVFWLAANCPAPSAAQKVPFPSPLRPAYFLLLSAASLRAPQPLNNMQQVFALIYPALWPFPTRRFFSSPGYSHTV